MAHNTAVRLPGTLNNQFSTHLLRYSQKFILGILDIYLW